MRRKFTVAALAMLSVAAAAKAEETFETWAILRASFPSTGGNGIIIGEYRPILIGDRCLTNFTATEPSGTVHHNIVLFEAVPAQGGILCANGKWSALDGSASGTTPFRVFFKDGVIRGSP